MTITIPDLEILEEKGIDFSVGNKVFKLKFLSAFYYNLFHSIFTAYLIEFGKIFGTDEITITESEIKIKEKVAESIMYHKEFQYLVYQLFIFQVYPEMIFNEYKLSQLTDLQKKIYKKDFKFKKKIQRYFEKRSIEDYREFLKSVNPAQILTLFFYLLIVNIQGYKKKVKIIMKEMKNRTGIPFGQISITDILKDYFPKGQDQWGKMSRVNGEAVFTG